jgi:hypothetical protein
MVAATPLIVSPFFNFYFLILFVFRSGSDESAFCAFVGVGKNTAALASADSFAAFRAGESDAPFFNEIFAACCTVINFSHLLSPVFDYS